MSINHKWGCLIVMAVCGGYLDAQSAKGLLRVNADEKERACHMEFQRKEQRIVESSERFYEQVRMAQGGYANDL